ncbi:MAG TPA: cellulase family glycosylhydrolase [Gaiellaceae bacterium]|nr:cellulase family glycosylhydrolase [Gaiellaceae bacterium]
MLKVSRLALVALIAFMAVPAAAVKAAPRMPIGFFDDPSFRWSPTRAQNLQLAQITGASIIHTTATWASIAPTRPANPANGDDPAYRLTDLDDLVFTSSLYGMRVMINITGTPKWANGGKAPNVMPTKLSDLTTFARMLAARYNGRTGHGTVSLWSVWNEPNLQLFLTPQFSGKKIVGPANYAKLFKAAYAGIKSGNPWSKVAIGETSARGRDKPLKGVSDSIAPGTFAHLLSTMKGLKFDAWAVHPYPVAENLPPLAKVRYPNVTLSTLPRFESDLKKWFKRTVPVWITEYGHQTKPADPHGVTLAQQAKYAQQALTFAKNDPNVQMFIWFVFRDNKGDPWKSGFYSESGAQKPAFDAFGAVARLIDGTTMTTKAGAPPLVTMYVPYLAHYSVPGTLIGMTYVVYNSHGGTVAVGQPTAPLEPDQSVTFVPKFTPVKGQSYTVVAQLNEPNGHTESRTAVISVT